MQHFLLRKNGLRTMAGDLIDQFLVSDLGSGYYQVYCPRPSSSGYYLLSHNDLRVIPQLSRAMESFGFKPSRKTDGRGVLMRRKRDGIRPQMFTYKLSE
jgi:hypothetical protein